MCQHRETRLDSVTLQIYTCSRIVFMWQRLLIVLISTGIDTEQKLKFSINGFFSKCDQIRRKLRIWSHLLKKSLMEDFIFCAVRAVISQQHMTAYAGNTSVIFLVGSKLIKTFMCNFFGHHLKVF